MVRLERAAADLQQLGVAPQPLDDVLAHVAVAAEHLDGGVGGPLARLGSKELRRVGVDALAHLRQIHAPRRVVHQGPCGPVLGEALGDVALHLPVLADRHAEALALVRPRDHHPDAAPRDAHRHGGQRHSLDLEVAHHGEGPLALLAEAVGDGDAHAVEDQLRREGRAHAELVLPLLAQREARHPLLHQERTEAALAGGGVHDEGIAECPLVDATVGDEGLGSGQDVGVALAHGPRAHGEHVRPHLGLGHAHPADPLARGSPREDVLSLHVVAVDVHVLREEHGVGEHSQGEARVGGGERVADLDARRRVEARTSVLLGDRHAQQPQLSGAAEERVVEALLAVVLRRLRLHLARHELGEGVGEKRVLRRGGGEIEPSPVALVHAVSGPGGGPVYRAGPAAAGASERGERLFHEQADGGAIVRRGRVKDHAGVGHELVAGFRDQVQ